MVVVAVAQHADIRLPQVAVEAIGIARHDVALAGIEQDSQVGGLDPSGEPVLDLETSDRLVIDQDENADIADVVHAGPPGGQPSFDTGGAGVARRRIGSAI